VSGGDEEARNSQRDVVEEIGTALEDVEYGSGSKPRRLSLEGNVVSVTGDIKLIDPDAVAAAVSPLRRAGPSRGFNSSKAHNGSSETLNNHELRI
jgi:hypothetical protein